MNTIDRKDAFSRRTLLKASLAGLGFAAASGIAGCGSSNSGSGTVGSAAGSAAASETYTLIKEGTLTVATSVGFEPFEFMEDGEYKGFDLDLIRAIGDKLGLTVEFANVDFDTILPGVASGTKYDCAIGAITITPQRKKEVDFTDPYYMDDQAVATRVDDDRITGDNFTEVLNQEGMKIAVQSGSTAESIAKEDYPNAERVIFKTATEDFAGLQANHADALITGKAVALRHCATTFDTCHVIGTIPTGHELGIVVNKQNPGLRDALDAALDELTEDGTVDELMAEYDMANNME